MKKIQYLCILLSGLFALTATAQEGETVTVRDFEVWSSATFAYKAGKNLKFSLEEQIRLKSDASEIDQYFTELGAQYNFGKHLYAGVAYRYSRKNDNTGKIQGYENFGRLNFDLGHKFDLGRFGIDNRLRYQTKNELGVSAEEGDVTSNRLRFKTSIGYNIKKWKLDPKFSAEIFRLYEEGEQTEFNKFRLTLGTNYDFKNIGKLGIFYRMEKQININNPKVTNILGLKYIYTFKKKKEE